MVTMSCDDAELDFMMDLSEFARRLGIKPRRAETDSPAEPKQPDTLDLYAERLARLKGEVSKPEIREAKPEQPYEPLADYRFWEEVNRRREAESQGKPLPQWHPCARSAEPQQEINLYAERLKRKAENK